MMMIMIMIIIIIIIIIMCLIFKVDYMGRFCGMCGRDEKNNRIWKEELERKDHVDLLSIVECMLYKTGDVIMT